MKVTTAFTAMLALIFPCFLQAWQSNSLGRRQVLQNIVIGTGSGLLPGSIPAKAADRFTAYQVHPDASSNLSPSLNAVQADQFLQSISSISSGALWLGEHHNAERDHNLQELLVDSLHQNRKGPLAIGLEQVEIQFQPILDDFVAGKLTLVQLRQGVEWNTRWTWSFDTYAPVFHLSQNLRIPLIALNVNSEDLALVEKDGLPGLPNHRLKEYIIDRPAFASFARGPQYSTYVDYVIRPSFELHQSLGLLKYTRSGKKRDQEMSFRNFFSGRILWDQAMATRAYLWTRANEGGLMVGLAGADHIKFQNGIPGRYAQLAGPTRSTVSVLLNPTLIDTRPSGSVSMIPGADSADQPDRLTLQLRYLKDTVDWTAAPAEQLGSELSTGGVLPLADYLLVG